MGKEEESSKENTEANEENKDDSKKSRRIRNESWVRNGKVFVT